MLHYINCYNITINMLADVLIESVASSAYFHGAMHCIFTSTVIILLPSYAGKTWNSDLAYQICTGAIGLYRCIDGLLVFDSSSSASGSFLLEDVASTCWSRFSCSLAADV